VVNGQGSFFTNQLERFEVVAEHHLTIDERYLGAGGGGGRVVHIVSWPRWRNISKTNFPNLSI
jgi:hypothetical protein